MGRLLGWLGIFLLLVLGTGCTSRRLACSTSTMMQTLEDLRVTPVLDNLAMFCENPAALPNPIGISNGVVQVSDNGNGTASFTWNPLGVLDTVQYFLGITASRTVSDQWSLTPVHNPEKLTLLRTAYQSLVGSDLACRYDGIKHLEEFLGKEEFAHAIPQGWYHVGSKHDVPRDACYCGHHCGVYVWVTADGVDGLSQFTLTVLRIVLSEPHVQNAQVIRTFEGPISADKLKTTEVKTTEPMPVRDRAQSPRSTGDFQAPSTGLQFVPR